MRRSVALAPSLFSLLVLAGLTGCGGFNAAPSLPGTTTNMQMVGTVLSGKVPVAGAQVRLYVAGNSGNASAATDLMGTGSSSSAMYTTTALDGTFSLQGDFTCPSATSSLTPQVYLIATGGNPGLSGNVNNASLVLMDALGPCASLTSTSRTTVNEVTTVAAAWALSGFMTSATNVGSTATNAAGLTNAFLNAHLIADPAAGTTPGSALATNTTIETGKVAALANVIATCSGSDGSSACQKLFTASGVCTSTCTSDTLATALYIVKHPGGNASSLYALGSTANTFASTLSAAPNDWTLSMTVTGGGLKAPTELAIDTIGNVWVADYRGAVSAFNPQGTALSPAAGFGSGVLAAELYGLAIDGSNNVWVAVEENPSAVSGLYGISSGKTLGSVISVNGSTNVTSNNIYFPESLATGQDGSIIIGNYGDQAISTFNYSASAGFVFGLANAGVGYISEPTDESGDANGGVWVANNGDYTVAHIDKNGFILSHPNCCNGANGIATDKLGNAWVSNYAVNSVSEILPGCDSNASSSASCYNNQQNVVVFGANASTCSTTSPTSTGCGDTGGGLASPSKLIVDAAQNIWVANYHGVDVGYPSTITELAGNGNTVAAGTPLSPSTVRNSNGTVTAAGGFGLDAKLLNTFGISADASGNLWTSNNALDNVVMFFGLAAPTATPRVPVPVTP
jgi:hypothetical protein